MLRDFIARKYLDIYDVGHKGSDVPQSGDDGPGIALNDLSLPADNDAEIMVELGSGPTAGTLGRHSNGGFEYTGPTGVQSFTYQLKNLGVNVGSPTLVSLYIDTQSGSAIEGTLDASAPAFTFSGLAYAIKGNVLDAVAPAFTFSANGYQQSGDPHIDCTLDAAAPAFVFRGYAPTSSTSDPRDDTGYETISHDRGFNRI